MQWKHTPWIVSLTISVAFGIIAVLLFSAGRTMDGLYASASGITTSVLALVFYRSAMRPDDSQ